MYFTVFLKAAELVEVTQDQSWSDPTWTAKEESVPALLKELTVSSAICLHIILRKKVNYSKVNVFLLTYIILLLVAVQIFMTCIDTID